MTTAATPMLRQYQEIKSRYQDCILFFRLGDFYEMFFDDAKQASQILDLVLTSRGHDATGKVPMCGIPYHSADSYIAKLIKASRKVAICEQVEDPAQAKGIVKRDVIRIISAGTYLDDNTDARYLLSLTISKNNEVGFAFADTTGGAIFTNHLTDSLQAVELIAKLPIVECLYPESNAEAVRHLFAHPAIKNKNIALSSWHDWTFNTDMAYKELCRHLSVHNLNGFGIENNPLAQSACGGLLEYLKAMNKTDLKHIDRISLYSSDDYVFISPAAHYGLEMSQVHRALDLTQTPMGRRTFSFWLYHPLKDPSAIIKRQQAITKIRNESNANAPLEPLLNNMPDLEKALSRISCSCATVKDLLALRQSLLRAPLLEEALRAHQDPLLKVNDIPTLREYLNTTINPDVPLAKPEGKIINAGIDPELDDLRQIQENGRQWLLAFQAKEIKRTGINSLKVGFNNVFGYYIEITKTHQHAAPADYIRKQTLANQERYITPELKEYEEKILTAQDKILAIEKRIVKKTELLILEHTAALHAYADSIGRIDTLLALSRYFDFGNYILPTIDTSDVIDIKQGRHPLVEKSVPDGFTPNDTLLDTRDNHLIILTGPNMAGKSTYIRQTALLVIMAQMGAPIPAASAQIGVADKIFTRIGAHDEIAKGQSTFMVEMTETAHILNNLTPRSLVILDEIGRGTSTSDGLSLAWALAEHMHAQRTRTLFATHFHELVALADQFDGIKNYNVAVNKWKDKIIFLHKIVPGGSDDSYGIYVAKLAGIPHNLIKRSHDVLRELESGAPAQTKQTKTTQLNLFTQENNNALIEIRDTLEKIDINNLTPLDALSLLHQLKEKIKN